MLRLDAVALILGARDAIIGVADHGIVLSQLRLEFRNFKDGHQLAGVHSRAVIHQQLVHVARLFGIDVGFLERHELGGDRQTAPEALAANLHDANPDGRGRGVRLSRGRSGRLPAAAQKQQSDGRPGAGPPLAASRKYAGITAHSNPVVLAIARGNSGSLFSRAARVSIVNSGEAQKSMRRFSTASMLATVLGIAAAMWRGMFCTP